MSRLDDELERAVRDAEATVPATAVPAPPRAPAPKRNVGLLIGLLVICGGILTLVFTSFEGAAIYSKGVDQVVGQGEKLSARTLRVEGTLVKGSLTRRDQPCEYRFRLSRNGAEMKVHYAQCVVPDTFRDRPDIDVMVTAEGKLSPAGHLEATTIFAKCPSKYDMQQKAAKGEKAPHGELMPAGAIAPPIEKAN